MSLGEGEFESATADDHFRYFATFVRTLLTDFAAYLDSGEPALEIDRVGYRQVPLLLTDEEFDRPIATMASAVQEHVDNRPAPGRRQRLLSTIVMPDDRPDVLILLGLGPQRTWRRASSRVDLR